MTIHDRVGMLAVPALVLLAAAGCTSREPSTERPADSTAAAAPAVDPANEARALFEGQVQSWNAGDPGPSIASLADDVLQLQPDTVYVGAEALAQSWRRFHSANTVTWTPTVLRAAGRGDLAFIRASFTETSTPKVGGASRTERALGLEVYQRDAGGAWKLAVESWYNDPLVVPTAIRNGAPRSPATDSVRAVFDAYEKGWTDESVEGAVAVLHDDVVQLTPDTKYVGKEVLGAHWRESNTREFYKWSPTVLDIAVSGDLAVVRYTGIETSRPRAGGAEKVVRSSGWSVFRRDGSGGWKLAGETWYVAE